MKFLGWVILITVFFSLVGMFGFDAVALFILGFIAFVFGVCLICED